MTSTRVTGGTIASNRVTSSVSDGIQLCGDVTQGCGSVSRVQVADNYVSQNKGAGIDLLGAQSNTLKANRVSNNGTAGADTTDGIRADANSTQNRIDSNTTSGNVTHDCHDSSAGAGTAGTANFWTNNQGATQNRGGLCTKQTHGQDHDD